MLNRYAITLAHESKIYYPQRHEIKGSSINILRGGSIEYPQSMFLSRNKKNNVYPCKPQFYYIKVGFLRGGAKLYRHVFVMALEMLLIRELQILSETLSIFFP